MFAKSIRLRFQLWLAFLLLAVLSGFGFTAYQLYRTARLNEIDSQLERRVAALSVDVRGGPRGPGRGRFGGGPREHIIELREQKPPLPEERPEPPPESFRKGLPEGPFRGPPSEFINNREIRLSNRTQGMFDESDTNSFYFAVWSPNGNLLRISTNAPSNLARPARLGRETTVQINTHSGRREAHQYTEIGDAILIGHSIANYDAANRKFALLLFAAGAGVLFVGLGGGWMLTSRALQPVHDISKTAMQISGGDLSQRIDVADTDSELGQLANLLNSTFSRLEAAFAQQKQFTADAAHELRTPLAVIISETQTTLQRPRTLEEYRETVEACLETAQGMRALTHSLLELARFDAGQEHLAREPFDLAEVAKRCVADAEKIARERDIRIVSELGPAPASGDAARIAQVITNLLANAIHYNQPGGEVHITTRAENGTALLTVKDTGQGIAADAMPHIFERFYRVDPSRTHGAGHSGLGLAISKAIVEAHNGTISVESVVGEGTTFTVRI